ncbi:hypothetical protein OnM2_035108 [Erysiphe neolycopersici]|uniref:Uncharacterized protein n=1 Tax=Erysiphe neolycopersici TaxID=212602 RepID=A0A420HXS6_9PEZI|nr:hypothetical protein OnM2_035108 [Erysiphe neolycopersici]
MTTRQNINFHYSSHPSTSSTTSRLSIATSTASNNKSRQLAHLHSKLASLSANLADLENLLRMTSIQAESIKGLSAWHCGLFMAASKVLGEETIAGSDTAATQNNTATTTNNTSDASTISTGQIQ